MAKRKKRKQVKRSKPAKKPVRKPTPRRKKAPAKPPRQYNTTGLQRYRAISSSIRDIYKEQGKAYDRATIREQYHQKKEILKDVPIQRIPISVDAIYGTPPDIGKNEPLKIPGQQATSRGTLPKGLDSFPWFDVSNDLVKFGNFFKPDDIIRIDMSATGKQDIVFPFSQAAGIYDQTRLTHFRTKDDGDIDRVEGVSVPEIEFVREEDGVFIFGLMGQTREALPKIKPPERSPELPPEQAATAPSAGSPASALELEKEKTKQIEEQEKTKRMAIGLELEKTRIEAIAQLERLYDKDLISKKEFKARLKKIG